MLDKAKMRITVRIKWFNCLLLAEYSFLETGHLPDVRSAFEYKGLSGNSAILIPKGSVSWPSELIAPRAYSSPRAECRFLAGGGDGKLNLKTLSIPRAFNCNTAMASSVRCISGGAAGLKALKSASEYNLPTTLTNDVTLGLKLQRQYTQKKCTLGNVSTVNINNAKYFVLRFSFLMEFNETA